jgi:hypothetical protein
MIVSILKFNFTILIIICYYLNISLYFKNTIYKKVTNGPDRMQDTQQKGFIEIVYEKSDNLNFITQFLLTKPFFN